MKKPHNPLLLSVPMVLCIATTPVTAHGLLIDQPARNAVDSAVVFTWRSAAAVDDNTAWRMPGFLMGGESWPVDEGVALDEVSLTGKYALDDNLYGVVKAGIHGGGKGSDHGDSVEIQHAYVGWRNNCAIACVAVEAGKMSALFSPSMTEHPSTRIFSESSLILDTLFGRDFHDQGARALVQTDWGFSGGVEHWRGQQFPATPTDGDSNTDIFIRYDLHTSKIVLTVGAWAMRADATMRTDHRYSADHVHSSNVPTYPAVGFSGTSDLHGIHGNASWSLNSDWALSVSGEWVNSEADGFLQNNQRIAGLLGKTEGSWIQPAIHWRKHTLALRAEQLKADNYLEGPGAPALTIDSGLSTNGHTPERFSAAWLWQWHNNVALRVEAIDDQSLPDEASRINVGVVWRKKLL